MLMHEQDTGTFTSKKMKVIFCRYDKMTNQKNRRQPLNHKPYAEQHHPTATDLLNSTDVPFCAISLLLFCHVVDVICISLPIVIIVTIVDNNLMTSLSFPHCDEVLLFYSEGRGRATQKHCTSENDLKLHQLSAECSLKTDHL